jgi:peptidoglycan hydrolase CwlO-like protein
MMHLEQALIEAATTQGIWVLLFISLFLYTIKNNEKLVEKQDQREVNYQKLLSDMTEKYAVVEDIRNSVDEIQKKWNGFR